MTLPIVHVACTPLYNALYTVQPNYICKLQLCNLQPTEGGGRAKLSVYTAAVGQPPAIAARRYPVNININVLLMFTALAL